ncbi:MAG: hypothetical protein B7Z45_04220 [Azorhizobium sp. 12-66-6]|nr:MAG: hypothetical protein B7Z45_04220 [Azorhizobium sp. 12-66-6]
MVCDILVSCHTLRVNVRLLRRTRGGAQAVRTTIRRQEWWIARGCSQGSPWLRGWRPCLSASRMPIRCSRIARAPRGSPAGEGPSVSSEMLSTSWEDGSAAAYRFKTLSRQQDEVKSDVDATATRTDTGLSVKIAKPRKATVELTGKILLPTEHLQRVIAAAKAGETVLEARVFDGSDDGVKVFDTLAVIGRAAKDEPGLPEAAKVALAGHTYHQTSVSYFEPGGSDQTPDYVMSFSLYDNGVIGALSIDYNDFVLRGRMEQFEPLKASAPCDK